eukprot:tig00000852_g5043.t1
MAGNPGGPLFSELYSHPACADSISALAFDPCQEIVWCGSQQGRLTSFLFPGLERYSACQAHVSDVRGLLPDAGGVVSISADTVRYHDRGCVLRLQHTFSVGEGVGLQAFTIADPNRWHLALGGDFGKLLLFDLNSSRILNQTEVDISTTSMKLTRAIVCGTSTGALQLRDPRNLRLEATLEGHSGPVLDMDVRGNLIVTCGLSLRGEQFFSDPLIRVTDTCDVQAGGANAVFSQVNLMGEELTAMGLGTAGQVLGFTDSAGYLHVWADRDEPTLNLYSAETPIVPAFPSPPLVPCTEDGPFSLVPLPVKQVEFVGYLQNPGLFRRNSRAASRPSTQTGAEDDRPAHLSSSRRPSFDLAGTPDHEAVPKRFRRVEIKLNKLGVDDFDFGYYNKTCFSGLENSLPNSFVNSLLQLLFFLRPLRVAILNHLCNVPICLACELAFLFHMMERSNGANCQASNFLRCFQQITQVARLGLLEPSDSPLSALNPGTLPVGRRLHSLARFLLEHVSKELDGQPPSTQHLPKPLAPTIRGSPHGSPSPSPPVSPAKGNRRSAAGQPALPDPAPSPHGNVIDKLLGFSSRTCSRCPQGHNTIRESRAFVIDLQLRAIEGASDANTSFARLLESTLHVETDASRAWCDQCGSYQRMSVTRMVTSLPNAFAMNSSASEAVRFSRPWRVPCLFLYTRVHLEQVVQLPPRISPLNSAPFERDSIPPGVPPNIPRPFKSVPQRMIPGEGSICAIDCEFVALSQQEEEVRADGSRNVVKPSRMGLARVSVVRGDGAREGEILIDDYILNTEPVVDYLTRFSGLHPGDLDPSRSRHHLIALKDAYVKLRYLVDRGVRLVGHGLKKDFRTINIFVPPDQIIDTVELFSLRRQRKISLKFLAAFLLHIDIQSGSHDSVEDARTALALYRKYQQLCADGEFEDTLDEIYRQGRRCNWTLTAEALATLQHPAEPAGTSTPGPPMAIPIPSGKHSSLMPPPPPSAKHAS